MYLINNEILHKQLDQNIQSMTSHYLYILKCNFMPLFIWQTSVLVMLLLRIALKRALYCFDINVETMSLYLCVCTNVFRTFQFIEVI